MPAHARRLSWGAVGLNPFERSVGLELLAVQGGRGLVAVYSVSGQRVATLYDGPIRAGGLQLHWDGRDLAGRQIPPGLYLVRARIGAEVATTRVLRMR